MGLALGSRALSFALWKLGLSDRLALAIAFFLKGILTAEGAANFMMSNGEGTSGEKLPLPAWDEQPVPSISSQGDSWISETYGDGGDASSLAPHQGQSSLNPASAGPATPVASPEEAASPPGIAPYPYPEDQVIGGDSVNAIKSRLLANNPSPSFEELERARIDAQDRFEIKVDIIQRMSTLDPEGDWEGRGARALDNPRTLTGETSLEKLFKLKDDLERGGVQSEAFRSLKSKFF